MAKFIVKITMVGPTGRARITKYLRGGAPLYANRLKDAQVFASKELANKQRDAVRGLMRFLAGRNAQVSVCTLAEEQAEHRRADALGDK